MFGSRCDNLFLNEYIIMKLSYSRPQKLYCDFIGDRLVVLPTALVEKVKQPVASVCFHSIFWTDWPLNLSFFVSVRITSQDPRSPEIEGKGHRSRLRVIVRVRVEYWLAAAVTSCALARRGARQRCSAARVGVITKKRGRSYLDRQSRTVFFYLLSCFFNTLLAC